MTMLALDMSLATCATMTDSTVFHVPSKAEKAKTICGNCPVQTACLEATLEVERGWGKTGRESVFGGLTPAERYKLDRARWPKQRIRNGWDDGRRRDLAS